MSHIQPKCVSDHETSFENPEKPFVAKDWRDCCWIEGVEVEVRAGEVFDCSVDCADSD